jgi:DNA-binding transcriptional regulator YhcF (GntR family)
VTPAVPPYQRIIRQVTDDIRAGRLKPGDPVPGAARLGDEHGVSKSTAQRALNELKDAGLISSVVGVGITVSDRVPPEDAPTVGDLAGAVADHETRLGELEAMVMDLYSTIGRPRPTGDPTSSGSDRKDRRGHGRADRPSSAAGA